jgi:hypothetical protein
VVGEGVSAVVPRTSIPGVVDEVVRVTWKEPPPGVWGVIDRGPRDHEDATIRHVDRARDV